MKPKPVRSYTKAMVAKDEAELTAQLLQELEQEHQLERPVRKDNSGLFTRVADALTKAQRHEN